VRRRLAIQFWLLSTVAWLMWDGLLVEISCSILLEFWFLYFEWEVGVWFGLRMTLDVVVMWTGGGSGWLCRLWWRWFCWSVVVEVKKENLKMSSDSHSRSRSRSRSPGIRKIRSDRFSYRDAPYRRDSSRGFRLFFKLFIFRFLFLLKCVLVRKAGGEWHCAVLEEA
jgi:hypothetical protein